MSGLGLVGFAQVGLEVGDSTWGGGSLRRERDRERSCSEMEAWHWTEGMEADLRKKGLEGWKGDTAMVVGERVKRGCAMDGDSIHNSEQHCSSR